MTPRGADGLSRGVVSSVFALLHTTPGLHSGFNGAPLRVPPPLFCPLLDFSQCILSYLACVIGLDVNDSKSNEKTKQNKK